MKAEAESPVQCPVDVIQALILQDYNANAETKYLCTGVLISAILISNEFPSAQTLRSESDKQSLRLTSSGNGSDLAQTLRSESDKHLLRRTSSGNNNCFAFLPLPPSYPQHLQRNCNDDECKTHVKSHTEELIFFEDDECHDHRIHRFEIK